VLNGLVGVGHLTLLKGEACLKIMMTELNNVQGFQIEAY
jgi:hypothetical protein